jgi:hypothetical protein
VAVATATLVIIVKEGKGEKVVVVVGVAIGSRSVGVKPEELVLLLRLWSSNSKERKQSINGQVVVVVDGPVVVAGVNAASVLLTATRWSIVVRSSVTTI